MASHYAVDDSKWDEVTFLNGYAVFMAYLMMGVRGLGVLVFTWTTVVLLGGFVSDLRKEDFWCLTGITLVQTAGVFDFLLKDKLGDLALSWWGLLGTVFATVNSKKKKDDNEDQEPQEREIFERREEFEERTIQVRRTYIFATIPGLVFCILLCPLGVLYVLGLYISAGVSLWRLIKHNFGDAGGANKKPALQVLYSLAVAQGVLFGYKVVHARAARKKLAKFAAEHGTVDEDLVAEYLEETLAGCEKDPSFARGRNLVTYGVDLMMDAKSNEGFIAGIRVLGGAIKRHYSWSWTTMGRKVLAKHLLMRSDSSSYLIQRLLETVGPRSPYSKEVREHAARILALVASGIRLEQFPAVIGCINSVLDTPNEHIKQDRQFDWIHRKYGDNKLKNYHRIELLEQYELDYLIHKEYSSDSNQEKRRESTVHGFNGLVTEAVNIIHQLSVDKDNRRIMSNTVLRKVASAPLSLHKVNHDACSISQKSELQMLEKCWILMQMEWFVEGQQPQPAAPLGGVERGGGEIVEMEVQDQRPLRTIVESALGSAIKDIFNCVDCGATQKKQGIQILLHLSLDMSFTMETESSKRRLRWILLLIYRSIDDSEYWMISGFTYHRDMPDFSRIRGLAGERLLHMLRENHELPPEERDRELHLIRIALTDLKSALAQDSVEDIFTKIHAAIIMEGICFYYDSISRFAEEAEEILGSVIPEVVVALIRWPSGQAPAGDVEHGPVAENVRTEQLRKALVSLCRGGYMGNYRLKHRFHEMASKSCEQEGKSFKYFKSLLV